jgi:signal recognition particle receptor subunit beta
VRQLDQNIESLQNLQANLLELKEDARSMPIVFQYNKQDLPGDLVLTPEELDQALNFWGVPSFPSDALRGEGVFETLRAVSELVLRRLSQEAPA